MASSVIPVDASGDRSDRAAQPETPARSSVNAGPDSNNEKVPQTLKVRIHRLVEEPESGQIARFLSGFILITITLSIACFMFETVPQLRGHALWQWCEMLSSLIFTAEYMSRLLTCDALGKQTKAQFVKAPMNIMDALAILPFYMDLILEAVVGGANGPGALRVLRSVRLIRLFRILKLGRYSSGMHLMLAALRNAMQPLSILGFFLCIGVILFSSLLYFAEKWSCPDVKAIKAEGRWDAYTLECRNSDTHFTKEDVFCCDEHMSSLHFPSIVATFWWAVVTMTTVGYGDQVPHTGLGRIVAGIAMVCGIGLISLPVAIVGSTFQEAWQEMEGSKALAEESARQEFQAALEESKKVGALARGNFKLGVSVVKAAESMKMFKLASKVKDGPKKKADSPPPGPFRSIPGLRVKLQALLEMPEVTQGSRKQIGHILGLFDQVDRIEAEFQSLKVPDMALQATIRQEFNALVRVYDSFQKKVKDSQLRAEAAKSAG